LNSGNTTDSELWGNASGLNLTGALIASGAVSAASATLGTPLTVANGGTGAGTFTTNAIIKGNGTSALAASGCSVDANNSISCSSATTFQPQSVFQNTTADSGAAVFNFQKSRTGAAVNTGDSLGILVFQGFTTSYVNAAEIYASTAGAVSGANVPTTLTLKTSNSAGQLNNSISFDSGAHFSVILQPTATTVTSCGSSPSISGAKDLHGTVTVGTGAPTACTIGFGATFASTPDCVVTSNPQVAALSWVTSTSGIVVTQTGTSSNKLVYSCLGGGS
jgi:hypothetical protein